MLIRKQINIGMPVTPEELAMLFEDMGAEQQVEFFNSLGKRVRQWEQPFCMQMVAVYKTGILSEDAVKCMKEIGEAVA